MGNMLKREWFKRLIAVTLSLVVAVTFIPLLGDAAFAEGEDAGEQDTSVDVLVDDNDADAADDSSQIDAVEDETPEEVTPPAAEISDEVIFEQDAVAADDNDVTDTDVTSAGILSTLKQFDFEKKVSASATNLCDVTVKRSGSSITVNAKFNKGYKDEGSGITYSQSNLRFKEIYFDANDKTVFGKNTYRNSVTNEVINLSNVGGTGYHQINLGIYGYNTSTKKYDKLGFTPNSWSAVYRVGIFAAPSASGNIAVYHNYLDYMSPVDGNLINYKLFLEYNGKVYGPMSYLQSAKITGLAPNSNYGIISYYGVYKDGSWFTGKEEGRYRSLGTYRTGVGTTPQIKSVKVKATKVKKKTQKVYGYYTGLYLGKRKYYRYSIKITVKLKKAPGTNGIWINGKKFKGNKKKYTVKLGPYTNYSKPKGKKFTVMIYSYYNNSYGGYSPMYRTVKKVK